jgi:hypothetical protein
MKRTNTCLLLLSILLLGCSDSADELVFQKLAVSKDAELWWSRAVSDINGDGTIKPSYVSTDVDPSNGKPLKSEADGGRHFEIYRGERVEGGVNWRWIAVTSNSRVDNIRPIVPKWDRENTALLWLRGD